MLNILTDLNSSEHSNILKQWFSTGGGGGGRRSEGGGAQIVFKKKQRPGIIWVLDVFYCVSLFM